MRQGTTVGLVLEHHEIQGACDSAIPCLCNCVLWSHILRHRAISWMLGLRRLCCLLVLLYLWPIGGSLSRGGGPVCDRTGGILGPTLFPFSEGGVVESGSTYLGWWGVGFYWDWQWGIPVYLCLFLLKIGMIWYHVPRLSLFIVVGIPIDIGFGCISIEESCVQQADLLLRHFGVRGGHPISVVHRAEAA